MTLPRTMSRWLWLLAIVGQLSLVTVRAAAMTDDRGESGVGQSLPGAPTGVIAVAGNGQATVLFSAPASDGGSPITSYTVAASPGGATVTGSGSPLVVTGLTNGTTYSFTVRATSSQGTGPASAPSSGTTPTGNWARVYPGGATGTATGAMDLDPAGNAYMIGVKASGSALTVGSTTYSSSQWGLVLSKTDPLGQPQWSTLLSGAYLTPGAVAVDREGSVYVIGTFQGGNLTAPALTLTGWVAGFLAKYSTSGTLLWAQSIHSPDLYVYPRGVAVGPDGSVFVTGTFRGNLTQPVLVNPSGSSDAGFLVKYAPDGTSSATRAYAGVSPAAVTVDAAGYGYVAGSFQASSLSLPPGITKFGSTDGLVIKTTASGDPVWARNFGGASPTEVSLLSVAVDGAGRVYVAGSFHRGNLTSPSLTLGSSFDGLVVALESSGTILWSRSFGEGTGSASGSSVTVSPAGDVYAAMTLFSGGLPGLDTALVGYQDVLTVRFTASGGLDWVQNWGGNGNIGNAHVRVDAHGNVVVGAPVSLSAPGLSTPVATGTPDWGWVLFKRTSPLVNPPRVSASTSAVTSATTVTLGGTVSEDGGAPITSRGVVYVSRAWPNTNAIPRTFHWGSPTTVTAAGTVGTFSVNATGLAPATPYIAAAFATSAEGTRYGPSTTFTTPSNVATLSALTLSQGTLSPAFTGGTVAYVATVASVFSSITVTPTVTQANATVGVRVGGSGAFSPVTSGTASGALALTPGANTLEVLVTAQDGTTTRTYTVTVTREAASAVVTTPTSAPVTAGGATLGGDVTSDGGSPITARGVVYALTSTNATPVIAGVGVQQVAAASAGTGPFSVPITGLPSGTSYSFRAYATNSVGTAYTDVGTFTTLFTVRTLSALSLNAGPLIPMFASDTTAYSASVQLATTSVTVTPTVTHPSATVQVRVNGGTYAVVASGSASGSLPLDPGANVIDVLVTAEDGSTHLYTVTVTRAAVPGAPTAVRATAGNGQATVQFAAPASDGGSAIASYTVTAYPGGLTASGSGSPIVVTGLANGTTYSFIVRAVSAAGSGPGSAPVSATPSGNWARAIAAGPGAWFELISVAVDASGNVYIAGPKRAVDLTVGTTTYPSDQVGYLVVKFDAGGTVLWSTLIRGPSAIVTPGGIATDSAGNLYVTGDFVSGSLTTPALTLTGNAAGFLVKYSPSGAVLWATLIATASSEARPMDVAVGADDSVFIAGRFGADLVQPVLARPSSGSTFLLNYAGDGTLVRASAYELGISNVRLHVDASGASYIVGFGSSAGTSLGLTRISSVDEGLVVKMNTSGTVVWARNFGGPGAVWTELDGVTTDAAGRVYVTGNFYGGNLTSPALTSWGGRYDANLLVIALEPSGTVAWARNLGGSAGGAGLGLAVSPAGDLHVTGYLQNGSLSSLNLTTIGYDDQVVVRFDAAGTPVWAQNWGGRSVNVMGHALTFDANGNLYTTGATQGGGSGLSAPIGAGNVDWGWLLTKRTAPMLDPPKLSATSSAVTSSSTATLGGTVATDGGTAITARGVAYVQGTSTRPRLGLPGVASVQTASTENTFTLAVSSLSQGTVYTAAAYATNAEGTRYGPTATFTTPSNVATLSALTLSSGTLSPVFASGTTVYEATVASPVASVTVTPTVTQANATIEVRVRPGDFSPMTGGSVTVALAGGANVVDLLVRAQNGTTTQTYTVTITREVSSAVVTSPTSAPVTASGATLGATVTTDSGSPVSERGVVYALTAVNPNPLIGGGAVQRVLASEGGTGVFSVPVSGLPSGTGYSFRAYAINSVGTAYSDVATFATLFSVRTLSSLALSSGPLSPLFSSDTTAYSASVTMATTGVTVTPTATHPSATVRVRVNGGEYSVVASGTASGTLALEVGANAIDVLVTAEDGSTRTYTATVTRADVPGAPTAVRATGGNGQITVRFTAPATVGGGIVDYAVTAYPGNVTATGSASPLVLSGLTNGTAYTLVVRAFSTDGGGPGSTPASATPTGNWAQMIQAGAVYNQPVQLALDESDNIYMAGAFSPSGSEASLTLGDTTYTSADRGHIVSKRDPSGSVLWSTRLRTANGNGVSLNALAVDGEGNAYVTGWFEGQALTVPALSLTGVRTGFLVKYSPAGATLWARTIQTSNYYAMPTDVAVRPDGSVVVVGTFNDSLIQPVLSNPAGAHVSGFMLTYLADGTSTGAVAYRSLEPSVVTVDSGGVVYIGGIFGASSVPVGSGITVMRTGYRDGLIVKVMPDGTTFWARQLSGSWPAEVYLSDIAVDSQGRVNVAGYFVGAGLTSPTLPLIKPMNGFITQLAASSSVQWARAFGEVVSDPGPLGNWAHPYRLAVSASDHLYASFRMFGSLPSYQILAQNGATDILTMHMTPGGDILWQQVWGGPHSFYEPSIEVDSHGNIVVAFFAPISDPMWSPVTTGPSQPGWLLMKRTVPLVNPPSLSASSSVVTSATTATLGGTVADDGGSPVTSRGIVFRSTADNPTAARTPRPGAGATSLTASGTTGTFTAAATGLTPGVTYRGAAFATTAEGTRFGPTTEFTTPSNVATLSALTLSAGTLSPAFASGVTTYATSVSYATTSITVTPTVTQANATVGVRVGDSGAFTPVTSGSASGALALAVGANTVDVQVTAQDGVTTNAYRVTVTREGPTTSPTVTTPTSGSVTATGATLGGSVTADGGAAVTERGVVYALTATNADPVINGTGVTKVVEGSTGTGAFTNAVTGLTAATGYSF